MIDLYYTPEILAYYINKFEFSQKEKIKLIHKVFYYEKAFIHPKYQNNKKLFLKKTLEFTDYLLFKDDLDDERELIQKDMHYFGNKFKNDYILSKRPPLNFFFVTTRLQLLFSNREYIRIKLKTLLKNYGYKKKSDKILMYLQNCMYFYHIQGFNASDEINLFEVDSNEWITFRVNDNYKNVKKYENVEKNTKYLMKLITEEFDNNKIEESKIDGISSLTYIFYNNLIVNFIVYSSYVKVKIHISPEKIKIHLDNSINYYLENNHIIYFLHNEYDLKKLLICLHQIVNNII